MYAKVPDVKRVLRGSTQDEDGGTAAELDDTQIKLEIENATATIDSSLRHKYQVPFNPVPLMIKSLCIDIAAYLADLNYRKSREYESDNYPIIRRHDRAREILEFLRTGVWTLDDIMRAPNEPGVFHAYEGTLLTYEDVFVNKGRDW